MNGTLPQQQSASQGPGPQGPPAGGQQGPPPLSQDLASLANILTQIQYDLFDVSVQLAQPPDPDKPFNSRIDDKAVSWIKDLINKISGQLPKHEDPILPVGSQLACEFYQVKTLAQRSLTEISLFYSQHDGVKPDNLEHIKEYLQQLVNLMFIVFRWSNLVMGEKEWFWKTKDQMKQQPQDQPGSPPQEQMQPAQGQAPAPQPSPNAPGVPKS